MVKRVRITTETDKLIQKIKKKDAIYNSMPDSKIVEDIVVQHIRDRTKNGTLGLNSSFNYANRGLNSA